MIIITNVLEIVAEKCDKELMNVKDIVNSIKSRGKYNYKENL